MQKICHVERFICTETPVEADGIQTFFLFEMSRTTKRQAKQQLGGNPFSPKYSEPRTKWVVQLFVYGVGLTLVGGSTLVLRSLPCPLPLPPRCPPLRRLLAPNLVRPLGSTAPGIHLPSVSHWHASAVARSGGSSLRRCSHFRTRIHVFSTHAHPTLQTTSAAAAVSDPAARVSPPSAPHARSRF